MFHRQCRICAVEHARGKQDIRVRAHGLPGSLRQGLRLRALFMEQWGLPLAGCLGDTAHRGDLHLRSTILQRRGLPELRVPRRLRVSGKPGQHLLPGLGLHRGGSGGVLHPRAAGCLRLRGAHGGALHVQPHGCRTTERGEGVRRGWRGSVDLVLQHRVREVVPRQQGFQGLGHAARLEERHRWYTALLHRHPGERHILPCDPPRHPVVRAPAVGSDRPWRAHVGGDPCLAAGMQEREGRDSAAGRRGLLDGGH
mmetsp:Transcript_100981/g.324215  ORF Transcript_100981/g.324215 Transcript_100981/m.324215 type:complete len:254 (+) Transcript_100981:1999-2760(+)